MSRPGATPSKARSWRAPGPGPGAEACVKRFDVAKAQLKKKPRNRITKEDVAHVTSAYSAALQAVGGGEHAEMLRTLRADAAWVQALAPAGGCSVGGVPLVAMSPQGSIRKRRQSSLSLRHGTVDPARVEKESPLYDIVPFSCGDPGMLAGPPEPDTPGSPVQYRKFSVGEPKMLGLYFAAQEREVSQTDRELQTIAYWRAYFGEPPLLTAPTPAQPKRRVLKQLPSMEGTSSCSPTVTFTAPPALGSDRGSSLCSDGRCGVLRHLSLGLAPVDQFDTETEQVESPRFPHRTFDREATTDGIVATPVSSPVEIPRPGPRRRGHAMPSPRTRAAGPPRSASAADGEFRSRAASASPVGVPALLQGTLSLSRGTRASYSHASYSPAASSSPALSHTRRAPGTGAVSPPLPLPVSPAAAGPPPLQPVVKAPPPLPTLPTPRESPCVKDMEGGRSSGHATVPSDGPEDPGADDAEAAPPLGISGVLTSAEQGLTSAPSSEAVVPMLALTHEEEAGGACDGRESDEWAVGDVPAAAVTPHTPDSDKASGEEGTEEPAPVEDGAAAEESRPAEPSPQLNSVESMVDPHGSTLSPMTQVDGAVGGFTLSEITLSADPVMPPQTGKADRETVPEEEDAAGAMERTESCAFGCFGDFGTTAVNAADGTADSMVTLLTPEDGPMTSSRRRSSARMTICAEEASTRMRRRRSQLEAGGDDTARAPSPRRPDESEAGSPFHTHSDGNSIMSVSLARSPLSLAQSPQRHRDRRASMSPTVAVQAADSPEDAFALPASPHAHSMSKRFAGRRVSRFAIPTSSPDSSGDDEDSASKAADGAAAAAGQDGEGAPLDPYEYALRGVDMVGTQGRMLAGAAPLLVGGRHRRKSKRGGRGSKSPLATFRKLSIMSTTGISMSWSLNDAAAEAVSNESPGAHLTPSTKSRGKAKAERKKRKQKGTASDSVAADESPGASPCPSPSVTLSELTLAADGTPLITSIDTILLDDVPVEGPAAIAIVFVETQERKFIAEEAVRAGERLVAAFFLRSQYLAYKQLQVPETSLRGRRKSSILPSFKSRALALGGSFAQAFHRRNPSARNVKGTQHAAQQLAPSPRLLNPYAALSPDGEIESLWSGSDNDTDSYASSWGGGAFTQTVCMNVNGLEISIVADSDTPAEAVLFMTGRIRARCIIFMEALQRAVLRKRCAESFAAARQVLTLRRALANFELRRRGAAVKAEAEEWSAILQGKHAFMDAYEVYRTSILTGSTSLCLSAAAHLVVVYWDIRKVRVMRELVSAARCAGHALRKDEAVRIEQISLWGEHLRKVFVAPFQWKEDEKKRRKALKKVEHAERDVLVKYIHAWKAVAMEARRERAALFVAFAAATLTALRREEHTALGALQHECFVRPYFDALELEETAARGAIASEEVGEAEVHTRGIVRLESAVGYEAMVSPFLTPVATDVLHGVASNEGAAFAALEEHYRRQTTHARATACTRARVTLRRRETAARSRLRRDMVASIHSIAASEALEGVLALAYSEVRAWRAGVAEPHERQQIEWAHAREHAALRDAAAQDALCGVEARERRVVEEGWTVGSVVTVAEPAARDAVERAEASAWGAAAEYADGAFRAEEIVIAEATGRRVLGHAEERALAEAHETRARDGDVTRPEIAEHAVLRLAFLEKVLEGTASVEEFARAEIAAAEAAARAEAVLASRDEPCSREALAAEEALAFTSRFPNHAEQAAAGRRYITWWAACSDAAAQAWLEKAAAAHTVVTASCWPEGRDARWVHTAEKAARWALERAADWERAREFAYGAAVVARAGATEGRAEYDAATAPLVREAVAGRDALEAREAADMHARLELVREERLRRALLEIEIFGEDKERHYLPLARLGVALAPSPATVAQRLLTPLLSALLPTRPLDAAGPSDSDDSPALLPLSESDSQRELLVRGEVASQATSFFGSGGLVLQLHEARRQEVPGAAPSSPFAPVVSTAALFCHELEGRCRVVEEERTAVTEIAGAIKASRAFLAALSASRAKLASACAEHIVESALEWLARAQPMLDLYLDGRSDYVLREAAARMTIIFRAAGEAAVQKHAEAVAAFAADLDLALAGARVHSPPETALRLPTPPASPRPYPASRLVREFQHGRSDIVAAEAAAAMVLRKGLQGKVALGVTVYMLRVERRMLDIRVAAEAASHEDRVACCEDEDASRRWLAARWQWRAWEAWDVPHRAAVAAEERAERAALTGRIGALLRAVCWKEEWVGREAIVRARWSEVAWLWGLKQLMQYEPLGRQAVHEAYEGGHNAVVVCGTRGAAVITCKNELERREEVVRGELDAGCVTALWHGYPAARKATAVPEMVGHAEAVLRGRAEEEEAHHYAAIGVAWNQVLLDFFVAQSISHEHSVMVEEVHAALSAAASSSLSSTTDGLDPLDPLEVLTLEEQDDRAEMRNLERGTRQALQQACTTQTRKLHAVAARLEVEVLVEDETEARDEIQTAAVEGYEEALADVCKRCPQYR